MMLTIVGDVIEFDGKPFAIITAPLSGWRMDAIDAVGDVDRDFEDKVETAVKENRADDQLAMHDAVNEAVTAIWLDEAVADYLHQKINEAF